MDHGKRLNGWKEIAAHLGKGVRTSQRWEKDFSLPIHRIGKGDGEIVYTYTDEVELWAERLENNVSAARKRLVSSEYETEPVSHQAPEAGPNRSEHSNPGLLRRSRVIPTLCGLAGVAAVAGMLLSSNGSQALAGPAECRVRPHALDVLDSSHRLLWSHPFEAELFPQGYGPQDGRAEPNSNRGIVITDLDGTGRKQVLFVTRTNEPNANRLYCFEHDGTLRFVADLPSSAQFGDQTFEATFGARKVHVTRDSHGIAHIWMTVLHHPYFPSALVHLDAHGRRLGTYWSNGHITQIESGRYRGRDVLFVGACSNEHRGASLAVLEMANSDVTAPATNPKYVCHTCSDAFPAAFLVFPAPSRFRPLGGAQIVSTITTTPSGVDVLIEARVNLGGIHYKLSPDLDRIEASVVDGYMWSFESAVRVGQLPPAGPFEETELWPVLRWTGANFAEIWPSFK